MNQNKLEISKINIGKIMFSSTLDIICQNIDCKSLNILDYKEGDRND